MALDTTALKYQAEALHLFLQDILMLAGVFGHEGLKKFIVHSDTTITLSGPTKTTEDFAHQHTPTVTIGLAHLGQGKVSRVYASGFSMDDKGGLDIAQVEIAPEHGPMEHSTWKDDQAFKDTVALVRRFLDTGKISNESSEAEGE